RDGTEASNPALFAYLETKMVDVDYDLRRFLGILYNTKTYQRESTFGDVNLDEYHFPGPVLRRMTAEQIWDSLLAATIPAVDERKGESSYLKGYEAMKVRAEGLEGMKKQPQKILKTAEAIAKVEYAQETETKGLRKRIAAARESDNSALAKDLNAEMKAAFKLRDEKVKEIQDAFESEFLTASSKDRSMMMEMDGMKKGVEIDDRPDSRWKGFDKNYVRASELRSPAPATHFLRRFGQSDRETISAAESEASVAQVLSLLNGKVYDHLVSGKSQLMKGIAQLYGIDEKQDFIFMSLLTREPTERERDLMAQQFASAKKPEDACKAIIWSLLNTKELLFAQ
ncbi:MAG: DUF1553 domain-containing protein, partial [Verrucomicrobiales bacterium]